MSLQGPITAPFGKSPPAGGHHNGSNINPFVYSAGIGFGGALMFFFINEYEPGGPMSRLLRFLVQFVGALAILHKLSRTAFRCFSQSERSRL